MSMIARIVTEKGTPCPHFFVLTHKPLIGQRICWSISRQRFNGTVVKVEKLDPQFFDFYKITVANAMLGGI